MLLTTENGLGTKVEADDGNLYGVTDLTDAGLGATASPWSDEIDAPILTLISTEGDSVEDVYAKLDAGDVTHYSDEQKMEGELNTILRAMML